MQIFQAMALRTITGSPTNDERKHLVEFGEQVDKVRNSSLPCFFAKVVLSQRLLAKRTTNTSPPDVQEDYSFIITELMVLIELGGIEGVHIQTVN
jgi:hypothetical protein